MKAKDIKRLVDIGALTGDEEFIKLETVPMATIKSVYKKIKGKQIKINRLYYPPFDELKGKSNK